MIINKFSIFLCALYKKGGVGNHAMRPFMYRTGLQCTVVWCDCIATVPVKNFGGIRLFLELGDGAGPELADHINHVRYHGTPLCTFGRRYKGHPEAAVVKADALH